MSELRYYVYTLVDPDGVVFYVGKGQGNRMYNHRYEAKSGYKSHKCNKIRKIWREGKDYTEVVVFETDDEQEAYNRECDLILATPNLCNVVAGGGKATQRPETRRIREWRGQAAADRVNGLFEQQREIRKQVQSAHFWAGLAELDRRLAAERKERRRLKRAADLPT